jgi:hypothetical protein
MAFLLLCFHVSPADFSFVQAAVAYAKCSDN